MSNSDSWVRIMHMTPGMSSTLLRLCWETQQTFMWQHIWMCPWGEAALPVQLKWASVVPAVTRTQARNKTKAQSVRKDKERTTFCGHFLQKHLFFGDHLVAPVATFICTKECKIDLKWFTLPNWTDWYAWRITDFVTEVGSKKVQILRCGT